MKKLYTLIASVVMSSAVNAQIPNGDFESWTSTGSYMEPVGWATMNSLSVPNGHMSCERSTDYVFGGEYSMKVSSNTSLGQSQGGWGVAATGGLVYPPQPAFPITGHPTTLEGMYKFDSQNGDTAMVMVQLFYQGNLVSSGNRELGYTPFWYPFSLNLAPYSEADSANIVVLAYKAEGPTVPPNGNSTVWVDHFNWDVLIAGTQDQEVGLVSINLFPNPATDQLTIGNLEIGDELTVYGISGELIMHLRTSSTALSIDVSALAKGMYLVRVTRDNSVGQQRFVVE